MYRRRKKKEEQSCKFWCYFSSIELYGMIEMENLSYII